MGKYGHLEYRIINFFTDCIGVIPCTGKTTIYTTSRVKITIRARSIESMFKKVNEDGYDQQRPGIEILFLRVSIPPNASSMYL